MQEENPNSSEYLEIIRMVDAFRYSSEYSLRGAVDNLAEIIVLLTAGAPVNKPHHVGKNAFHAQQN